MNPGLCHCWKEKKREYDSDRSAHLLGRSWKLLPCWRLSYLLHPGDYSTSDISLTKGSTYFPYINFCFPPFQPHLLLNQAADCMALSRWHEPLWNSFILTFLAAKSPWNPGSCQGEAFALFHLPKAGAVFWFFYGKWPLSCFLCSHYTGTCLSRLPCHAKT